MLIPVHVGTDKENTPLIEQLISRNDELVAERMAALADNDALAVENEQLRCELAAKYQEVA